MFHPNFDTKKTSASYHQMTPKLPVGKERSLITSESLPQKAEFRDFHLQTPNLSKQIPYTTDYFANFLQ